MASSRIGENMEDRYLFKGKFDDSGRWVKGQLVEVNDTYLIIPNHAIKILAGWFSTSHIIEVKKDTICQCTGLKDKNGKLIWENDIMVAHLDDEYPEDETYIRILWRGSEFCSKENGSEDIAPIDKFDREHFEVCGNIFDNPELLESEEKQ
jgi:uncharacterized phage protein (TIGR01671 family)